MKNTRLEQSPNVIALLYSRRHFNPGEFTPLENSSAGQIAKTLYTELTQLREYEIHYFDAFDHTEWYKLRVDILITLVDNFELAEWYFKPEKVLLIAVNQHPLERLRIAMSARKLGYPDKALVASDGIYQPYKKIRKSNAILCVGNKRTAESFEKYINGCKIVSTRYNSSFSKVEYHPSSEKIQDVLVLMSSLGFRKGFDRFLSSLESDKDQLRQFKFHIVGYCENDFWKQKLEAISTAHPNVFYHGWILNTDPLFEKILANSDVAIFPTREEGLVGSLLECLDLGILCLFTNDAGLDNHTDLLTLSSSGPLKLGDKLIEIQSLSPREICELRESQWHSRRKQLEENRDIGETLIALLAEGIPDRCSTTNRLSSIRTWMTFPFLSYRKILLNRLKFTSIRIIKAKIYLKSPDGYRTIIRLRNLVRGTSKK